MIDFYVQQFESSFHSKDEPAFLGSLRQKALERFASVGFPTTKEEEWRYTSVHPLLQIPFEPLSGSTLSNDPIENFQKRVGASFGEIRLVFLNGKFVPELSLLKGLPPGARVSSLGEALHESPEVFEKYLTKLSSFEKNPFVALNTAFLKEGAFLFLPKGLVMERPIHFMFVSDSEPTPFVSYPRNLMIAEEGVQANVMETYWGRGVTPYFSNAVTEIFVGDHAIIEHSKLQNESPHAFHFASVCAGGKKQSQFVSNSISLGARLARNDLTIRLEAEGAECQLNGLYKVTGQQHVDHHTTIEHLRPHQTSRELYKGILEEKAKGVFDGRIIVAPSAPGTSAVQTNKNLLLSDDAQINTRPLLEIFNNDVKCHHGATTGRLDENQIFYLRSRGLDEKFARILLTYAFASEVIERLKIKPLRESLNQIFLSYLMIGEGGAI